VLIRGGLPRPEANLDIYDEHGAWITRGDLIYRDPPVVIQYDGATHFRDERQRRHDAVRDERVRDLGYQVSNVTADDRSQPLRVVSRIANARARAEGTRPRGFLHDGWPERVAAADEHSA
jgi:hypothetical protein